MKNLTVWLYASTAYLLGFASLLLFIGFTLSLISPINVNTGGITLNANPWLVNIMLILLFGMQHSVMARKSFKQWLCRFIPEALERSTFLIGSAAVLIALVIFWQPLSGNVWQVSHGVWANVLLVVAALGWALVLYTTF